MALQSQPSYDTVSKGIHTITKKICGYNEYGDSTGLILEEYEEYNIHGQEIKNIRKVQLVQDMETDPEAEDPEAGPWYYEQSKNHFYTDPKQAFDTSRYQYNAKLRKVKYSSRDHNGKPFRHVYAYDVNGNCTSDIFMRSGKEEFRYEWKYNAGNQVISETITEFQQKPKKLKQFYYDEKNRLTAETNYSEYYHDSVAYSYSPEGKVKTVYQSDGSYDREIYNVQDSLISSVHYYNMVKVRGVNNLVLHDSIFIVRNEAGISVSYYKVTHYYNNTEVVTKTFDAKGRCLEKLATNNGKKKLREVYTYDDEHYSSTSRRYGYHYEKNSLDMSGKEVLKEEVIFLHDKNNRLIEERYFNGRGIMLERIVYTYSRY